MTLSVEQALTRKLSHDQAAVIRTELQAILASESFASSKRCRDFLEFIVERALAGDYESLTERFLGVELFGRAVDYETATDSIVRVRANDVRRRLAQHYSSERAAHQARIALVAGGYIPEFHWNAEGKTSPLPGLENISIATAPGANNPPTTGDEPNAVGPRAGYLRRYAKLFWVAGTVSLIAIAFLLLAVRVHQSNFDRFWQPVVDAPGAPVLNLPTTDTFQLNLDPKRTIKPLSQLKPGESLKLGIDDVITFHDWHVSLPVVQATLSVALALEKKGKVPLVRVGTDLRRDELRGHPIIAIGSFSNPWTEQNVSGLRFTFDRGASDREAPHIRDFLNPQRSWSLPSTYPEPQTKDYAIVTRTFDPVTREPFVSLAGLHSFGNQIAGEFVAQDTSWNEVAQRAPAGWEKMNLQVLLETNIVGTTPSSPRIVDVYFWK